MVYSTAHQLGIDVSRVDDTQEFNLGYITQDSAGTWYQYIKNVSLNNAAANYAIAILEDNTIDASFTTTTAGASPQRVGVPQTSIAAGQYGWLAIRGAMTLEVGANCAADVQLYTTATGGRLDDAATTLVAGIKLTTARGGTDGPAPAYAVTDITVNTS